MAKTYVPTLRLVAQRAYRYGVRWQPQLEESLTGEQLTCLTTWIAATLALITCLGPKPINP